MIAQLAAAALAAVQPGGGPGMHLPVPLPTSTGAMDVRIQMAPDADAHCTATGAGAEAWIETAAGACAAIRAALGDFSRPSMAVDIIVRSVFVAPGETAPSLPDVAATEVTTETADVEIDAVGHVAGCTPVTGGRRVCERLRQAPAPFQPAAEGGTARRGRLNFTFYTGGAMGEMMRRRLNGAEE